MFPNINFFFGAECGFFKINLNIKSKVCTGSLLLSSSTKKIPKNISKLREDVIEPTEPVEATTFQAVMPKLIVNLAFFWIF